MCLFLLSCVQRLHHVSGDPQTVLDVYGYDPEEDAERALDKYINGGIESCHRETGITKTLEDKYMNWFLPSGKRGQSKL